MERVHTPIHPEISRVWVGDPVWCLDGQKDDPGEMVFSVRQEPGVYPESRRTLMGCETGIV